MKKILLVFAGVIVLMTLYFLLNPKFSAKREALGSAGKTLVTADHHHVLVAEGGKRVLAADHNLAVITRATRYIATFGSSTSIYREIARIAAETDHECPELEDVLDLAVRSTSEAGRILALARSACALEGEAEEAAWQEAFEAMDAMAAYPTVEIAEEKQGNP